MIICKKLKTDDILIIIQSKNEIILPNNTETMKFNDLGYLINIVNVGGLFNYARQINKTSAK
uniref:Uncharacterized protein n=1 Tax=Bostrychia moritziana TaxID=103713 RepID=A0A1Z1M720_BOSMO|nr:hypothetical protein [Bostrychia moritziana]ARW61750.1 hypothetical protein [Bostrychia moritziana]